MDREEALDIRRALESAGIRCWMDVRNTTRGKLVSVEIEEAMNRASVVLVVIGSHGWGHTHREEFEIAKSRKKNILGAYTGSYSGHPGEFYELLRPYNLRTSAPERSRELAELVEHLGSKGSSPLPPLPPPPPHPRTWRVAVFALAIAATTYSLYRLRESNNVNIGVVFRNFEAVDELAPPGIGDDPEALHLPVTFVRAEPILQPNPASWGAIRDDVVVTRDGTATLRVWHHGKVAGELLDVTMADILANSQIVALLGDGRVVRLDPSEGDDQPTRVPVMGPVLGISAIDFGGSEAIAMLREDGYVTIFPGPSFDQPSGASADIAPCHTARVPLDSTVGARRLLASSRTTLAIAEPSQKGRFRLHVLKNLHDKVPCTWFPELELNFHDKPFVTFTDVAEDGDAVSIVFANGAARLARRRNLSVPLCPSNEQIRKVAVLGSSVATLATNGTVRIHEFEKAGRGDGRIVEKSAVSMAYSYRLDALVMGKRNDPHISALRRPGTPNEETVALDAAGVYAGSVTLIVADSVGAQFLAADSAGRALVWRQS